MTVRRMRATLSDLRDRKASTELRDRPTSGPRWVRIVVVTLGGALAASCGVIAACSSFTGTDDPVSAIDGTTDADSFEASSADAGSDGSDAQAPPCAGSGGSRLGLYVVGGETQTGAEPTDIYRAEICADGDLGPWLPLGHPGVAYPVVFGAGAVFGSRVVIASGQHSAGGLTFQDRAFIAVLADGGVGPFDATNLSAGIGSRWRAAFTATPTALVILGGEDLTKGSVKTDAVQVVVPDDAGAVMAFSYNALPEPLSRGAAVVSDNAVVTFGGTASGKIYAAALTGPSALGGWNQRADGYPNFDNAAVVARDSVWLVGGAGSPTSLVRVTISGGSAATIILQQPLPVLPRATSAAGVATYGDFLYVTGGVDHESDVYLCKLSSAIVPTDCRSGPPLPVGRRGHLLLVY